MVSTNLSGAMRFISEDKMIFQALGSPFSHDICSCMGNHPSNHEWFFGTTDDSNIEVYCDYDILGGFESKCENKFLWICESKVVVPDQMRILTEKKDDFLDVYKAVFVHDKELLDLDDRFVYAPPAANVTWVVPDKQKIYEKSKLVSMVSSGKSFSSGHTFRNNLMVSLKEKCPSLDIFGRSFRPFDTKDQVLADYMFSVTVENESYSNYYTEKLLDCFATGCVPVYHGTPDLPKMFNPDGVITLTDDFDPNDLNEDLYHSMMPAIKENFELQKAHKMSDDVVYEKIMERL